MRSTAIRLAIEVVALTLALGTGCAQASPGPKPPAPLAPGPASDLGQVVEAFQNARNAGDAASAAARFADNGIWVAAVATGGCSRQAPCVGRPAMLANLQSQVARHFCATTLEQTVRGSVVSSRAEVRNETLRSRGIERELHMSIALVDQGKIIAYYSVPDLSDAQTAASAAIAAGTRTPGAPIPSPATPCG